MIIDHRFDLIDLQWEKENRERKKCSQTGGGRLYLQYDLIFGEFQIQRPE